VTQSHLIKTLEDGFGEEVNNLREYTTPGTPRLKIVRPGDNFERIDSNLQIRCRVSVGMLLFLIKHSRPDLANVICELLKCMVGESTAVYNEMLRVVKLKLQREDDLKE
jgi:hypothetical protein